jgi:hypothetical protein
MEKNKTIKETHFDCRQNMLPSDRRDKDRRREPCEGFTYVSTVGWICRREKSRRKNKDELP